MDRQSGSAPLLDHDALRGAPYASTGGHGHGNAERGEASPAHVAAIFALNALHGRDLHFKRDGRSLQLYHVFHSSRYRYAYLVVVALLLLLATIEGSSSVPSSLPFGVLVTMEALCLLVCAADVALEWSFTGRSILRRTWFCGKVLVLAVALLDVLVAVATQGSLPRVSRALRPFFFVERMRNVRKTFSNIVRSVPKLLKIAMFITFHVVFFAAVGFVLLGGGGTTNYSPALLPVPAQNVCATALQPSPFNSADGECNDYFFHLWEGALQLFVLLTTANFPDVMLPYIRFTLWSSIFFVLFVFIGLYFFMSLILAAIFQGYVTQFRHKGAKTARRRRRAFDAAFAELSQGAEVVTAAQWREVVQYMRPGISEEDSNLLFLAADQAGAKAVGRNGFEALCCLSSVTIVRKRRARGRSKGRMLSIVRHRFFRWFFNLVMLSTIPQIYVDRPAEPLWFAFSICTIMLFTLEMVAKLLALRQSYFVDPWNLLDFSAVVASLASLVVMAATPPEDDDAARTAIQLFTLLRTVRMLRFVRDLRIFLLVIDTLLMVLPLLAWFFAVHMAVFYAFAILGMDLFSGALCDTCGSVASSSYGQGDYYPLNFDRLGSSFTTLFYVMVGNNWPVIMEGVVASVGTKAARLYFVLFYIVSRVVITNVFVAFMLQLYDQTLSLNKQRMEGMQEAWETLMQQGLARHHREQQRSPRRQSQQALQPGGQDDQDDQGGQGDRYGQQVQAGQPRGLHADQAPALPHSVCRPSPPFDGIEAAPRGASSAALAHRSVGYRASQPERLPQQREAVGCAGEGDEVVQEHLLQWSLYQRPTLVVPEGDQEVVVTFKKSRTFYDVYALNFRRAGHRDVTAQLHQMHPHFLPVVLDYAHDALDGRPASAGEVRDSGPPRLSSTC